MENDCQNDTFMLVIEGDRRLVEPSRPLSAGDRAINLHKRQGDKKARVVGVVINDVHKNLLEGDDEADDPIVTYSINSEHAPTQVAADERALFVFEPSKLSRVKPPKVDFAPFGPEADTSAPNVLPSKPDPSSAIPSSIPKRTLKVYDATLVTSPVVLSANDDGVYWEHDKGLRTPVKIKLVEAPSPSLPEDGHLYSVILLADGATPNCTSRSLPYLPQLLPRLALATLRFLSASPSKLPLHPFQAIQLRILLAGMLQYSH